MAEAEVVDWAVVATGVATVVATAAAGWAEAAVGWADMDLEAGGWVSVLSSQSCNKHPS